MSEKKPKQVFLITLIVCLVGIVGYQTWYLMDMKQQLDEIQGKHETIAAAFELKSPQPDKQVPIAEKAPVTTETTVTAETKQPAKEKQSDLSRQAQKKSDAQLPPDHQRETKRNRSAPAAPPSVFDDDYFNRPYHGQYWNPREEIARMRREMDRVFRNSFRDFNYGPGYNRSYRNDIQTPRMNVKEDRDKYTIFVKLPDADADAKDISVDLDGQRLTLKGKQKFDQKEKDAMGNVIFQQHSSGEFQRSITLSEPVEQNGMVTDVNDGVLAITIPKQR